MRGSTKQDSVHESSTQGTELCLTEASVLALLLSSQGFRAGGWSHSRSCHSAAYLSKPFFYIYFFLFFRYAIFHFLLPSQILEGPEMKVQPGNPNGQKALNL